MVTNAYCAGGRVEIAAKNVLAVGGILKVERGGAGGTGRLRFQLNRTPVRKLPSIPG
ncbi:MAG: hypothetical protein LH609_07840 [Rudanella sp.]|nr:hypothetical protein [Rudanella sp.]